MCSASQEIRVTRFAQPSINPLACCNCWAGLLGRAVFPPWNEGPNFGSYITESKIVLLDTKQADNRSWNNMLWKGISTSFRKSADRKDGRPAFLKNHVPQDGILASFILKGEGIRSCFWPDSGKDVLIYSFP